MEHAELRGYQQGIGASFVFVRGVETVSNYGDSLAEYRALIRTAGVLDLSSRGRLCLLGADRIRFLNGQVTNDIKGLTVGQGCYAALVTAKGRMQSDLNVYNLPDELLLDFEPGLVETVSPRLEKYVVADDVQIENVAQLYGLLSVQGPEAETVTKSLVAVSALPSLPLLFTTLGDSHQGEIYVMNRPRLRTCGFDVFVPESSVATVFDRLVAAAKSSGGGACGWDALEMARIEAGIPRFGIDMDETNFPQECGIEQQAVSYTKGCYIGQEILNRIHTLGHVNQQLCGLRLPSELKPLPSHRDKLFQAGSQVGYLTSTTASPALQTNIALGFVRKELNVLGSQLVVQTTAGNIPAQIAELPFV